MYDDVIRKEQDRKTKASADDAQIKNKKIDVLADLYHNKNPNSRKVIGGK